MLMLAICAGVRPRSARIVGINGATANQAKKQTKKAIHVRWKARIGIVLKVRSRKRVARCSMSEAPCVRGGAMQGRCQGGIRGLQRDWRSYCAALVRAHDFWSPKVVRKRGEAAPNPNATPVTTPSFHSISRDRLRQARAFAREKKHGRRRGTKRIVNPAEALALPRHVEQHAAEVPIEVTCPL
jgi:hypothetical protein